MEKQVYAQIIDNHEIAKEIYNMKFKAPSISKAALPGQFVHIRCNNNYKPLLRRPFSISQVQDNYVSIIYEVIGTGTKALSELEKGEKLDILGPLGSSFAFPKEEKKIFVIGGGVGVVPLSFLIDFIVEKKVQMLDNINLILGVRNSKKLILEKKFNNQKLVDLYLVTEDGSKGKKGSAIDMFKKLYFSNRSNEIIVYGGGPDGMLRELSRICSTNGIPGEITYENVMACGVGACLGCVIKTASGLKKVCKDGPVFGINEIKW